MRFMYESFFALTKRPFASVPAVDQYFPGTAVEAAHQTLIRCVDRAEGTGLVIGPSGSGKTLLCQLLAAKFEHAFQVVSLASGRLSNRRALLQAILFGLSQPFRGMDEGELRLVLVDFLTSAEKCPQGVLLLVDEAHTLPLKLLDEIRMLTNLVAGGRPCVRAVLAGSPILEERLASPKLESFSQRIVARCYLESFGRTETEQYLAAQIRGAGGSPERVLGHDVAQAVFQATDGVPRLINQVCDHALVLACTRGQSPVERGDIEAAWADLQQLPTPWNDSARTAKPTANVIEFGGLDDDEPSVSMPAADHDEDEEPVSIFRMSAEDEEPLEPAERVAKIQRALAELDDDFLPVETLGPEVALVFDTDVDESNPFDESFAEEEIVVDRYSQCDSARPLAIGFVHTAFATKPAVAVESPAAVAVSAPAPTTAKPAPVAAPMVARAEPTSIACQELVEAVEFSLGLADEEEPHAETVPLRAESPAGHPREEDELIVVEDGYDDVILEEIHPVAPVRRQEYRQLFARLRRSC
jgi:type II secretory pathway predicted ATPase ExeA